MGSSIIQFLTSCAFEASWAAWTQSISFKSPKWYQMIGYILKYTLTQSALIHSMTMPFILSYLDMLWMFKEFAEHILRQGRLKIWTSDSHWFSLSLEPLEMSLQKFQHSYNSWKMDSDKIWRVWLKNWTYHDYLMFLTVLAGNQNFEHLEPSYLVQSGFL